MIAALVEAFARTTRLLRNVSLEFAGDQFREMSGGQNVFMVHFIFACKFRQGLARPEITLVIQKQHGWRYDLEYR
jgi:hypothetical protein